MLFVNKISINLRATTSIETDKTILSGLSAKPVVCCCAWKGR